MGGAAKGCRLALRDENIVDCYDYSTPQNGYYSSNISNIFGGKKLGKKGKWGENPKKEKNEKELGLVVSQQTVIRNQAKTQRGKKTKKTSVREIFWGER